MVASPRRVLFVEDEPGISEPFSKALRREGYEPVVARTARRALELAVEGDWAIVLLDLTLPDGDGRDVCRAIRRASSVPILMLTARGTEADRIVGLELGADDYVVKPFSGADRKKHTSELQSRQYLVCRLLLEKKKVEVTPFAATS